MSRYRLFLTVMLASLLLASISKPLSLVHADGEEETPTATLTETPTETTDNPTATDTSTETVTSTDLSASQTLTSTLEASSPTNLPTSSSTATPTYTITPAPLLKGNYIPNQVLVRFKGSASDAMIATCLNQINGVAESAIEELDVTIVDLNSVSVSNAVATLSACPGVQYVEPNYMAYVADTIPSDSGWGLQYGLVNIRAPQGWDLSRGSSNVTIAIVDTGVDLGHPDLSSKIVGGHDFVNNDSIAQDDNGHGTHVAGIAAAVTNNGAGVAGVSWGARIMPVKVLNAAGGGTFANVAAGITWAADNGAQIINLSVGGPSSSVVLQNAVNYAAGKGVLIIAATGNTGSNFILYPAAYPNVIAVGATDSSNTHAAFSNYGSQIDLVAPGVNIYSTSIGGYAYRNGTSMSAAYVSGFAAILLGIPGNSAGTATSIMESTALDLGLPGWDNFYGNGLIQMDAAIQLALPPATATRFAQGPFVPIGGYYVFTNTFTPSATITSTVSVPPTETSTPEVTSEPTEISNDADTPTPEIIALGTEATPHPEGGARDWLIPCCSVLLILLGMFLLWYSSRRKKRTYSGLHF